MGDQQSGPIAFSQPQMQPVSSCPGLMQNEAPAWEPLEFQEAEPEPQAADQVTLGAAGNILVGLR